MAYDIFKQHWRTLDWTPQRTTFATSYYADLADAYPSGSIVSSGGFKPVFTCKAFVCDERGVAVQESGAFEIHGDLNAAKAAVEAAVSDLRIAEAA